MASTPLPTFSGAQWRVTEFLDSLRAELLANNTATEVRMYAYAVTLAGWRQLMPALRAWRNARTARRINIVAGTDHALSEPEAFEAMLTENVSLRLATDYLGTFHPKVVHLTGGGRSHIWIGSNNLTREGLSVNVEMAALIRTKTPPRSFSDWEQRVRDGSEAVTQAAIDSYRLERDSYMEKRAAVGAFVWTRREHPPVATSASGQASGRGRTTAMQRPEPHQLIMEIMPLETGAGGKQVQIPKQAAVTFFSIASAVGSKRRITIESDDGPQTLLMTIFKNNTVRLTISDLDYRDRPCIIVFEQLASGRYAMEIVPHASFPLRYRALLLACTHRTRPGSRRWGMTPS